MMKAKHWCVVCVLAAVGSPMWVTAETEAKPETKPLALAKAVEEPFRLPESIQLTSYQESALETLRADLIPKLCEAHDVFKKRSIAQARYRVAALNHVPTGVSKSEGKVKQAKPASNDPHRAAVQEALDRLYEVQNAARTKVIELLTEEQRELLKTSSKSQDEPRRSLRKTSSMKTMRSVKVTRHHNTQSTRRTNPSRMVSSSARERALANQKNKK